MVAMMGDPMDSTRPHDAQPQSVSTEMLQNIEEFLEDGKLVFYRDGESVGSV